MKILTCFLFACVFGTATAQDFPTEISAQYGPETGFSFIMPKLAYRTGAEGWYFGGVVSVCIFEVLAVTVAPVGGYRKKGIAFESSLAFTYVDRETGFRKHPSGYFLNVNPKIMLGHRVFAGFGPGIYLYKSKKPTNTGWDNLGKFNYELGYSENLRF